MQISSLQSVSARFTMDRTEQTQQPPEADRTRQAQVRDVHQAVKAVNQSGQLGPDRELTIALHRDTGSPVVRIIDRKTQEVIQQIPNERVLRMAEEFKRAEENSSGRNELGF